MNKNSPNFQVFLRARKLVTNQLKKKLIDKKNVYILTVFEI